MCVIHLGHVIYCFDIHSSVIYLVERKISSKGVNINEVYSDSEIQGGSIFHMKRRKVQIRLLLWVGCLNNTKESLWNTPRLTQVWMPVNPLPPWKR